jgi:hypothetical protein
MITLPISMDVESREVDAIEVPKAGLDRRAN